MLQVSGSRPAKRPRIDSPTVVTLPVDMWTIILARIGSTSLVYIFNAKRTVFREAINNSLVYRNTSLEILPRVPWKHQYDGIYSEFFNRYYDAENPGALFMRGLKEFCANSDLKGGFEFLIRASQLGSLEATLVHGMILVTRGILFQEKGLQILNARLWPDVPLIRSRLYEYMRAQWINHRVEPHFGFDCHKVRHTLGGLKNILVDSDLPDIENCPSFRWYKQAVSLLRLVGKQK